MSTPPAVKCAAIRSIERKAVKRNYTKLRRQQTGRGLTIALATRDGDEAINCAIRGAVDDRAQMQHARQHPVAGRGFP